MIRRRCALTALVLLTVLARSGSAATYPIHYRLSHAGKVSVAVYDAQGVLVRELLHALPQEAGEHTLMWDGLDRDGKGAPAGRYAWKLLQTQGLSVEYLLSVGSNYPIGTNLSSSGGPGTHVAPFTVATDGTGIYVAALQTENIESGLVKLSPDGKTRLWSQQLPSDPKGRAVAWEGARSIAVDKGEVYLLGHRFPQYVHVSSARDGAAVRAFDVSLDSPSPDEHSDEQTHGATDMDVSDGVLVVAYKSKNAIRWYNPATGALVGTAEVSSPSGVAVGRGGVVYVTTGERVVRVIPGDHLPMTVAAKLVQPGRLDVDDASGDLLVYQAGSSQQVIRLSSDGTVRRRYGAVGGRQDGLYVDRSFAGVTDLCADGKGGFFVAEAYAAPRRVAHFAGDGGVTQEWYGGQPWDTSAVFEPGNPTAMWVASASVPSRGIAYVMRVLVDYSKRTWRVHSCYKYVSPANPLMHGSSNEGNFFHLYEHAGIKYLAVEGQPCIWKVDEQAWRLVPVTAFGNGFQWNDVNGDGLVQGSEKTINDGQWPLMLVPHLDATFDYFAIDMSHGCQVRRVPVTGWNGAGSPLYGTAPKGEVYADCPTRFSAIGHADGRWGVFLYHDTDSGNLYAALNPGVAGWCTSGDSFVQRWNSDRRLGWQVGELGSAPSTGRMVPYVNDDSGQIHWTLRGIAGVAHGCLIATDVDGGWSTERAQTYVWDRDGLFVGGIMDKPDLNGIPEFMYHCGGEFAHSTLYTLPDGDVYFSGNWENETRLYRVTGWDSQTAPWVHASGDLTIHKSTPDGTGQGLTAEYSRGDSVTDSSVSRVDSPIILKRGVVPSGHVGAGGSRALSVRWRGAVQPRYGPRYIGNWTRSVDANASDGAYHRANNYGAAVEATFHGTSVAVVSITNPSCGYVDVYVDDAKTARRVGCYSPARVYGAVVFERKGLKNTDHTLRIQAVDLHSGPDASTSSNAYFTLDRFVVDGGVIDDDGVPYCFYTKANHGAELRLDGRSIIKDWSIKDNMTERASVAQKLLRTKHPIQLDFVAPTENDAELSLEWSSTFDAKQLVPATALFP